MNKDEKTSLTPSGNEKSAPKPEGATSKSTSNGAKASEEVCVSHTGEVAHAGVHVFRSGRYRPILGGNGPQQAQCSVCGSWQWSHMMYVIFEDDGINDAERQRGLLLCMMCEAEARVPAEDVNVDCTPESDMQM